MNYAAIILAAGKSSRMGSPKALLELHGETFLDRLIRRFSEQCASVTVVLGHRPEAVRSGLRAPSGAEFVVNSGYEAGQFSSLQCGMRAIPPSADGVFFTPVDYPNIAESTLTRLIRAQAMIAIPQYLGRHGHPVLISPSLVPEFLALSPHAQARSVLHRHSSEICYVDVLDPGVLDDIDDPEDYRRLLASV